MRVGQRMGLFLCCGWMAVCGAVSLAAGEEASPAKPASEMTTRQRVLADTVNLMPFDTQTGLEVLVRFPTGQGNAADHYAKLESLYEKEQIVDPAKEAKKIPYVRRVSTHSEGVKEILRAARIKDSRLSPTYFPYMESGLAKQPDLVIYEAYLHAVLQLADELEKAGKTDEAGGVYRSALIWGWHFTRERPNLIVFMLGVSIEAQAAMKYADYLQRQLDVKRANVAREFADRLITLRRQIYYKSQVFLGDFNNFNSLYSTIKVAKYDQDYMWRQEAVLRLGVYRHGAPSTVDSKKTLLNDTKLQRLAEEALEHVAAKDPAPWIRKLALWTVANVTPERFIEMERRRLGTAPAASPAAERKEKK